MCNLRTGVVCAVLVLILGGVAPAADDGPYCPQVPQLSLWGGGFPFDGQGIYIREYIPYYALYPPVYYSYPVPRPYGYSPFAYPPGTRTPEICKPEPLTIKNEFVPEETSGSGRQDRLASQPLRVANPYVPGLRDRESVVSAAGPQPQVVFPVALFRE
jgi:hypothetical protein